METAARGASGGAGCGEQLWLQAEGEGQGGRAAGRAPEDTWEQPNPERSVGARLVGSLVGWVSGWSGVRASAWLVGLATASCRVVAYLPFTPRPQVAAGLVVHTLSIQHPHPFCAIWSLSRLDGPGSRVAMGNNHIPQHVLLTWAYEQRPRPPRPRRRSRSRSLSSQWYAPTLRMGPPATPAPSSPPSTELVVLSPASPLAHVDP